MTIIINANQTITVKTTLNPNELTIPANVEPSAKPLNLTALTRGE